MIRIHDTDLQAARHNFGLHLTDTQEQDKYVEATLYMSFKMGLVFSIDP